MLNFKTLYNLDLQYPGLFSYAVRMKSQDILHLHTRLIKIRKLCLLLKGFTNFVSFHRLITMKSKKNTCNSCSV